MTKHGAYIDGFAAPQRRNHSELCSAKLVLEAEPKRVRDFWLCDLDPDGVALLEQIKLEHHEKGRRVEVVPGDFNRTIDSILNSGRITEKKATFALLDQRTFECEWDTVRRISEHKKTTKIEIFYFFPTGWIDRSMAGTKTDQGKEIAKRWWGDDSWSGLRGLNSVERANLVARRFREELEYAEARPYAIHNAHLGGRTMYHMIHATDHPAASELMLRAYRKVSGRRDWDRLPPEQSSMSQLWSEVSSEHRSSL